MNIANPIKFNCIKHHLGFIKERVNFYTDRNISLDNLKVEMLTIGGSQMDIYTGGKSAADISLEIKNNLKDKDLLSYNNYFSWITKGNIGYKLIILSDNSIWTLRLGGEEERYVHIHPARNSINSMRVKAVTLKTAIIYYIEKKRRYLENDSLKLMNDLRGKYLNEPPLKSLKKSAGISKLIKLLESKAGV